MKRLLPLLLCVLIAAAAGLYLVRGSKSQHAIAGPIPPTPVTVAPVQQRDLPVTIAAVGRAEAKASVAVKSRLDGQVAQVAFGEGQAVRKGQLLLRIDPAVLETQQRQAEAVLAKDVALLAKVQGDYQRNLGLMSQGFISQSALSQSRADLESAQSSTRADRAALDGARLQLGYTRVLAPMDGVAGALLAPVGSSVKANDTTLLVINQVQPIYVTFSLPESQLAAVKTAQQKSKVAVRANVAGIDGAFAGTLAFIDNAVDAATGSIALKALFPNPDGKLTPGQFAQVTLQLDALTNVLAVPTQAVESGIDGPYVFVVEADLHVSLRRVKVGPQAGGYQVVTSGLSRSERVVTSGQARLRDRSMVVIGTELAPGAATP